MIPPNRQLSGHVKPDVSVDIGINHILGGPGKSRQRGCKFLPVSCPVDIHERKFELADF
jgi:hypothetical protein